MAPSFFEVWRGDHQAPGKARAAPVRDRGEDRVSRVALAALLVPVLTAGAMVLRLVVTLLHPVNRAQRLLREGQIRAAAALLVFGTVAPLAGLVCVALWLVRALRMSPY
jgi:hypothetical protein